LYLGNNSYDFRNSGNSFPEEAWTHVALVYEANTGTGALAGSGTARLYQDGTEVASEEGVLFAVGDDTVTIGGRPSNQAETTENFSGSIDDVAFFSEALTGEQITALKDADGTVGMSAAETDLSVTYNGNGADVGSVPVDGNSYTAGDSVTVFGNTNGLSRPDYTFAGWNSRQDGSGDSYAADSTFSITQDVTLYAVWEPSGSGGDVPIGEVPIRVVPF
jgi:uncharacterized repeat protein (TIGR02543 family)